MSLLTPKQVLQILNSNAPSDYALLAPFAIGAGGALLIEVSFNTEVMDGLPPEVRSKLPQIVGILQKAVDDVCDALTHTQH